MDDDVDDDDDIDIGDVGGGSLFVLEGVVVGVAIGTMDENAVAV